MASSHVPRERSILPCILAILLAITARCAGEEAGCPKTCGDTARSGYIFVQSANVTTTVPNCVGECISFCRKKGFKYYDFGLPVRGELGCECYSSCKAEYSENPKAFLGAISACPAKPACPPPDYFPVTCTASSKVTTVYGVKGRKYTCSFRNPSKTLPIVNYQFTCANFAPLAVDDVTPLCSVISYIGPQSSRNFSFVNNLAAGTPKIQSLEYPHPEVHVSVDEPPEYVGKDLDVKCAEIPRLSQQGRLVLGTFKCNVTNKSQYPVRNVRLDCNMNIVAQVSNIRPDCTLPTILAPANKAGSSYDFSVSYAPGYWSLTVADYKLFK